MDAPVSARKTDQDTASRAVELSAHLMKSQLLLVCHLFGGRGVGGRRSVDGKNSHTEDVTREVMKGCLVAVRKNQK